MQTIWSGLFPSEMQKWQSEQLTDKKSDLESEKYFLRFHESRIFQRHLVIENRYWKLPQRYENYLGILSKNKRYCHLITVKMEL